MENHKGHQPATQDGLPVEDHTPTTTPITAVTAAGASDEDRVVEEVPLASVDPEVFDASDLLPDMDDDSFEALVENIRDHGILLPVLYDEQGCLLDGRQRLRAAGKLKMATFPRLTLFHLSEQDKADIRLGVNLNRRLLTRDQQKDVARRLLTKGRSIRDAGHLSGMSRSAVGRLAQGMTGVPGGTPDGERPDTVTGRDGKKYPAKRTSAVLSSTDHEQARAQVAIQGAGDAAPSSVVDLRRMERIAREQKAHTAAAARANVEISLPSEIDIRHQRLEDLQVAPETARVVFTDPPYQAENIRAGIYELLAAFADEVLQPGGFLVTYAPTEFLPDALDQLRTSSGLEYWWQVVTTFSGGSPQVPERHVVSKYRSVLIFRKLGGEQAPALCDLILGTGAEKTTAHPWQQSAADGIKILRELTGEGDLVVDPFLGSGTSAVAAKRTGCRFIGSEADYDRVQEARERVKVVAQV